MSSLKELQDLIHTKYGLDAAQLDPHASIRGAGLDSLTLVEFLFEVEDKFAVALTEDHSSIDTLAGLAQVVDDLRAAQAA